jgi:hypothetical protein
MCRSSFDALLRAGFVLNGFDAAVRREAHLRYFWLCVKTKPG